VLATKKLAANYYAIFGKKGEIDMSRLAKNPLVIPKGTELKLEGKSKVNAKGPKGTLSLELTKGIILVIENDIAKIEVEKGAKISSAFLGLNWALLRNIIVGVSQGYEKRLTLIGVGYRSAVQGNKLDLKVGYSHTTDVEIPNGINVKVENGTEIIVTGIDKQKVGAFAALVREVRKPEPYKGKGIRYKDEYVRKKAGKAAKGK
jgi:large subunit ribosomal protein L6